jgi:hypothetical protein
MDHCSLLPGGPGDILSTKAIKMSHKETLVTMSRSAMSIYLRCVCVTVGKCCQGTLPSYIKRDYEVAEYQTISGSNIDK